MNGSLFLIMNSNCRSIFVRVCSEYVPESSSEFLVSKRRSASLFPHSAPLLNLNCFSPLRYRTEFRAF